MITAGLNNNKLNFVFINPVKPVIVQIVLLKLQHIYRMDWTWSFISGLFKRAFKMIAAAESFCITGSGVVIVQIS